MSDVVAVMRDGKIIQAGPPRDIYGKPRSAFVAQFIGRTNFINGRVRDSRSTGNILSVDTSIGTVLAQIDRTSNAGDKVILVIRPEEIEVDTAEPSLGPNVFDGIVERLLFLGEAVECFIRIAGTALQVRLNPHRAPAIGAPVRVRLPPERCLALNPEN
jgi:iron(III) transport system ATP-binding protein